MKPKKMRVSFELDMEVFAQMLVHGNTGVRFDMYGEQPKQPRVAKEDTKLLSPPKDRPVTARILILKALDAAENGLRPRELMEVCVAGGFAKATHSPQLINLLAGSLVKRANGVYTITAKGKAEING